MDVSKLRAYCLSQIDNFQQYAIPHTNGYAEAMIDAYEEILLRIDEGDFE